jgi:probable HAF family extracellular repeat protein
MLGAGCGGTLSGGRECVVRRFLWLTVGALLLASVAVAASGGATQSEARWVITDLGMLANGSGSEALDINDRGQVVGWSQTKPSDPYHFHAFLWDQGRMRDLGTLGGGSSQAEAINERNHVVGWAETRKKEYGEPIEHAFLWEKGKMRDLGTLGGKASRAYDINERGQIVGWADTEDEQRHAFLWENGKMRDLGVPGSEWGKYAVGINDRGQVVGWSGGTWYSGRRAWLWEKGRVRSILLGGKKVTSIGINDRSQVVGSFNTGKKDPEGNYDDEPLYHAFFWQSGKLRDLTPGAVNGAAEEINDRSQIVGAWWPIGNTSSDLADRAALWQGGKRITLPSVRGDEFFPIGHANAINERGQIVGWSDTKFYYRAVLWTLKR